MNASDIGAGYVLLQEVCMYYHQACYFLKKVNIPQRKYIAIEKECFALSRAIFQNLHFCFTDTSKCV